MLLTPMDAFQRCWKSAVRAPIDADTMPSAAVGFIVQLVRQSAPSSADFKTVLGVPYISARAPHRFTGGDIVSHSFHLASTSVADAMPGAA